MVNFKKNKINVMRKLIFFLFLTLSTSFVFAKDVRFTASAPQAVAKGQQFKLTYSVNAKAKDLRVSPLDGFDVLMGPSESTSYSSSWVNGKTTSETTVTYTYILMAQKEGTFNIAPATIKVDGSNYSSNSLIVKVLPPDKASSMQGSTQNGQGSSQQVNKEGIFMRMIVSKNTVYEQEGFLVTFKLYSLYSCDLSEYHFPEFEGFLAQEIELKNRQWKLENYKGHNYRTVVLKQTMLYPQQAGKLKIRKGDFKAVVHVRNQKRIRSVFDDFFDSYQDLNMQLATPVTTINVKSLPAGKPASFSGAVGNFKLSSSINTENLKANEAVTITVKVSGRGNIKLIKNPEVKFPNDFETYDPKVDVKTTTTTAGVDGTKTIEYMAIPRFAGTFDIPPINMSYFNTATGKYETLTAGGYQLKVAKGEGMASSNESTAINNFSQKESVKYIGKDIHYLKVKNIRFVSSEELFYGSFVYWMCYLVPFLLFVLFFYIYRKQAKENTNLALVRNRKANKIAVKRLKLAGKLLKANEKESFYDEVLRAVWGYLSDKLNIPTAILTKDNVETKLVEHGVAKELIDSFMDILNTCEFARYAPAQADKAMDKLYDRTVDAIGEMENTIKK